MLENYAWAKGMTAVPTFLISSIWSWHNIRDILCGLRGRRPGLLLSLPKSSFQMKVNSAFHFEILNLWCDVPYHMLVLVVAGRWQCSHPQECFTLPSADKLYRYANFLFQQDLAAASGAKTTANWFADHVISVLDCPANLSDVNPIENLCDSVKRKKRTIQPKNRDKLKSSFKAIKPQHWHKPIVCVPRGITEVICDKGVLIKNWMNKWTQFT